jgi:hypothetical protein
MSSLSAMRERPLFSASRRPPAPTRPVVETPPSPSAEPEHPPFTLVGTAIGKTQNVAVILGQTTKNLVRFHSGEAASQWNLRSVDLRSMTVEKHNQAVALSLSATGANRLNGRAYDPNSDWLPMSSGATGENRAARRGSRVSRVSRSCEWESLGGTKNPRSPRQGAGQRSRIVAARRTDGLSRS